MSASYFRKVKEVSHYIEEKQAPQSLKKRKKMSYNFERGKASYILGKWFENR